MSFDFAFFAYENLSTSTNTAITVSNNEAYNYAASLKNWHTWDFCRFNSGSSSITFDCASQKTINYVAIAGHELFTKGATTVIFKGSNDNFATSTTLLTLSKSGNTISGSYKYNTITTISNTTVTNNPVIVAKLDSASYRYYRLEFNCTSACKMSVVSFGQRMDFEQGFYRGIAPPLLNQDVIVTNNKSESGIFLGRSIVRSGTKSNSISINNLSHDWIYNAWLSFKNHAEAYPFFYSMGNTPLFNNQLCYQTGFNAIKLDDRIGGGHGSVGVTFEGVIE